LPATYSVTMNPPSRDTPGSLRPDDPGRTDLEKSGGDSCDGEPSPSGDGGRMKHRTPYGRRLALRPLSGTARHRASFTKKVYAGRKVSADSDIS
jgi:hypothetical protein